MQQGFGKVVSSKVLVDAKTGASKCAGFLRFAAPEEADRAIHEMNNIQVRTPGSFLEHYNALMYHKHLEVLSY